MMLINAVDENKDCAQAFAAHAKEVSSQHATCWHAQDIQVERTALAGSMLGPYTCHVSLGTARFPRPRCLTACHLGGMFHMQYQWSPARCR